MKRALVTGGAGFIGSHLTRALRAQGIAVRVLDNLSSGDRSRLDDDIEFLHGDIRDAAACRAACRGVDTVFHLAALVSVPQSVADPREADAINIDGTLGLLLAARDEKARRMVFSSSSAVYGDTQTIPTHEEVLPRPASPYGVQKLTGEHYARNFYHLYGLETVCLRYFNVYGPRQNPASEYAAVIPKFLTRLLAGQSPTVFGDGEQTRDFCHVADVVAANLRAAETAHADAIGGVFNIASGVRTSLNQLLAEMRVALHTEIAPRYEAARPGDIRHSGADIRQAEAVLGFRPQVPLAEGLRRTAEFYKTSV